MESEIKIVYGIINTVKRQANDDMEISERLIRGYISNYRAKFISHNYEEGLEVPEECFQYIGYLDFVRMNDREFWRILPKIVRLKNNYGIMFEKNGYNIPIVTSEEYQLQKSNMITKWMPRAKFLGPKATICIGERKPDCANADALNALFDLWPLDYSTPLKQISVDVNAILDNPDDAPGYNWKTDPFPFPSELIEDMQIQILAKEFGISQQWPNDKVTDGNADPQQQVR